MYRYLRFKLLACFFFGKCLVGFEICEELWNPESSHIAMGLDGVEIICNSSGSYTELRKAYVTVDLAKSATYKSGGCYVFSNLRGCDGQRVYFNGCSCIAVNGHIINRSKQFALDEVVREQSYVQCVPNLIMIRISKRVKSMNIFNWQQSFIMLFSEVLLKNWLHYYSFSKILKQNCKVAQMFETYFFVIS